MASLASPQPVFSFQGYGRNKLENQVEQLEEEWQDERLQRVELQRLLKIEQRAHNDLHWELKETKNQLDKELKAHHDLKREWEAAKTTYAKGIEAEKQLKRDKKELKQRVAHVQEEVENLDKEVKKAKEEEKKLKLHIDSLYQERLVEEDKEGSFKEREIARANDRVCDLEKKMEELKRGFEIERGRYQNRQLEVANDTKRIQLEREKAVADLQAAEKRIEDKNKQLAKAFEEIDKLEEEAKVGDDELEALHAKILQVEQEKKATKT